MSEKKLLVVPALLKAHVDQYVKKDGTVVQAHDDKRQAAAQKPSGSPYAAARSSVMMSVGAAHKPAAKKMLDAMEAGGDHAEEFGKYHFGASHEIVKKTLQKHGIDVGGGGGAKPAEAGAPADPYGHPQVVGKAEKLQGGDASKAHGFHFAGKEYSASGKEGTSFHDGTPVRHFTEMTGTGHDDGQHVWMDHSGRVHADMKSEVKGLRSDYEAHAKKAAKPTKAAGPKPGHMDVSTLAAGHHLFDKNGQKVDEVESVEKHPMGGLKVNTRAGYSHMVAKDGRNDHGLTNKAPGGAAKPRRAVVRKDAVQAKKKPAELEHVPTFNEGYGFHGEAYRRHLNQIVGERKSTEADVVAANNHAKQSFTAAAHSLVNSGHFEDLKSAGKYLDSKSGRHLYGDANGGDVSKVGWLAQDVKNHKQMESYYASQKKQG